MGTVSKSFNYREFEFTNQTSLRVKNTIASVEVRDNVKALVDEVLQPLRDAWGKPLYINSGYRCPEVNKIAGGQPTSQHLKGEAADVCPFGVMGSGDTATVTELARLLVKLDLPFDQLGLYNTMIHISHKREGAQRKMIFYSKTYRGEKI